MSNTVSRNLKYRGRGARWDIRERLQGVHMGVVEYNIDPLKQGRCKVRIPSIHGTEISIETIDLPWASPLGLAGGLHDFGTVTVPPVGSMVYVLFLVGDPEKPLYAGGVYRNLTDTPSSKEETKHIRVQANVKKSRVTGKELPDRPISMGEWVLPLGPEVPLEILGTVYEPTTHLLFKSQKGATVVVHDRDCFEEMKIIDRSGQGVFMNSALTVNANASNASRRAGRVAKDPVPVDYSTVVGQTSTLELVGATGQGIRIVSRKNSEFIEVASKGNSNDRSVLTVGSNLGHSEFYGVKD